MKTKSITKEYLIGTAIGWFFYAIYAYIIYKAMSDVTQIAYIADSQIGDWVLAGPFISFWVSGQYLVGKNVFNEEETADSLINIKSSIIGFFVWLIVISLIYAANIEIAVTSINLFNVVDISYANLFGGWMTILLVYLYMKKIHSKPIRMDCWGYDV